MTRRPRYLSKQDVEQMMAAVDGPSASALEEITVLCAALRVPMAKVLIPTSDDPDGDRLGGSCDGSGSQSPNSGLSDDLESDLDPPSWLELVTAAAHQGEWSPQRQSVLVRAAHPDRAPDPEAVLDALWDLIQELNEVRTIAPSR